MARPGSTIIMYATLRQYPSITPAAFDALMGRKADIEALIRKVPGFVQYDLLRTRDGMTTLTICTDQAGAETSNSQVATWIGQNLPTMQATPPVITGGEDVLHFTA
jgi:hypothetical protein